MHRVQEGILYSASDLANHLGCKRLTQLDILEQLGEISAPHFQDSTLDLLRARGLQHERAFVKHLSDLGLQCCEVHAELAGVSAQEETKRLMRSGADVIVQAALSVYPWHGRADFLIKTNSPSQLGEFAYEVIDTKLARNTRAETILQLCLYSEMVEAIQGLLPERFGVVTPATFEPIWYNARDFSAYYRRIQASLKSAEANLTKPLYPAPVPKCEICRWQSVCSKTLRADDHPSFISGISQAQVQELAERDIKTLEAVSQVEIPLPFKPKRGSRAALERVREQARLQIRQRELCTPQFELRTIEAETGFCRLPEPSNGDVFLDLEGDHFAGLRGLEYLFGLCYQDSAEKLTYNHKWAWNAVEEKASFEWVVDLIEERRREFPDLHIYHYAPYEPAAFKRLMGAFASREQVIDDWLRNHLFVDLHRVVKEAVLAGVERYSIKDMEPFFGFGRQTPLRDAGAARARLEAAIELEDLPSVEQSTYDVVKSYNRDDCESTAHLRNWLEQLRSEAIASGATINRPIRDSATPPEVLSEQALRVERLVSDLTEGVPVDVAERTVEQQAKWLLAHSLDYYRREKKVEYWEKFRLAELALEDYEDDGQTLAGLEFVGVVGGTDKKPVHRYQFPAQECKLRDESLKAYGGESVGQIYAIDMLNCTVDIQRNIKSASHHPQAVYGVSQIFQTRPLEDTLERMASWVVENGMDAEGPFRAARSLLLRKPPQITSASVFCAPEPGPAFISDVARQCLDLDESVLPVQGPPGSGKTYLGAQIILALVSAGLKVGVSSNSHKAIINLLAATSKAANEAGTAIRLAHGGNEEAVGSSGVTAVASAEALQSIKSDLQVLGGTKFLWAKEEFKESFDVMIVDEASQLALADVLAISHAATNIILIGDPQQLDRPQRGSHPDGVDVSALDHLLGNVPTVAPSQGIFLPQTRRLHENITKFTSEIFYESRLSSLVPRDVQVLTGAGCFDGAGLHLVSVPHQGNQSVSPEEVAAIKSIVEGILAGGHWIRQDGLQERLTPKDILILAPYNAQVYEIHAALPACNVGTVDKFQGQEAPVAIYSMTTSSALEAPRGLDFLFSLNRLNVATSRARCASIIVASPSLLDVDCRTPGQMRLVNSLCRFAELATHHRTVEPLLTAGT